MEEDSKGISHALFLAGRRSADPRPLSKAAGRRRPRRACKTSNAVPQVTTNLYSSALRPVVQTLPPPFRCRRSASQRCCRLQTPHYFSGRTLPAADSSFSVL
jgi:hypothetical protein